MDHMLCFLSAAERAQKRPTKESWNMVEVCGSKDLPFDLWILVSRLPGEGCAGLSASCSCARLRLANVRKDEDEVIKQNAKHFLPIFASYF